MIRDSEQLLNDLINLNADAWNTKLAKELGVTVEVLRSITSKKDSITLSEDMIHLSVKNEDIKKTVKQISSGSNPINKYVIRYINNGETDKFIGMSCTGKVIIGIDFSESDMSNSYFCDCTFFNCSFSCPMIEFVSVHKIFRHGILLSATYFFIDARSAEAPGCPLE
jgi:hypothetical protein